MLASASPRRAAILRALGIAHVVRPAHIDESLHPGEAGDDAALRLAREKAAVIAAAEALPVLAADTVVLLDGQALGKPESAADAAAMLRLLAGRAHEVVTGVCVAHGARQASALDRTRVVFGPMSAAEIESYVATGEPMDKAGGYHIDGRAALYIDRVEGSPSNVAGLPVRLVGQLLGELGLDP